MNTNTSKLIISLAVFILSNLQLYSQNPTVSNVRFSQRIDGSNIVDIYYDLQTNTNETAKITMEVSNNDGITWDFSCNSLSGQVGSAITGGSNKQIIWDFAAEHPETFGDEFRIRITAESGGGGMGLPCPGIEKVYYEGGPNSDGGGAYYNTVQIGNQCWLKENLNYETTNSWCYDNNTANCDTYGRLYTWSAAMNGSTTEGAQGICPPGWHIPTRAEFETLENYVNDKAAALIDESETLNYTPTVTQNETGFSALLAGLRYDDGDFSHLGYNSYFWSSTEGISSSYAYIMRLDYDYSYVYLSNGNKDIGFSVRCVQD